MEGREIYLEVFEMFLVKYKFCRCNVNEKEEKVVKIKCSFYCYDVVIDWYKK